MKKTGAELYGQNAALDRAVTRINDHNKISKSQKKKIVEFYRFCVADGLSPARTMRYLSDMPRLSEFLKKDFEKATKNDFINVINLLEKTKLAPRTKLDFKSTIKKFYKWMNGGEEYPESVRWIKTGEKKKNHKLPEDLITEDEVRKLIDACNHSRDRAIIIFLWESGCRVGELLTMKIKNVIFEDSYIRVMLNGKTGMRRVPLIDSTQYIAEWLNDHPSKNDPEAPLWVGIGSAAFNKQLEYGALRKMLIEIGMKSEIKKGVNPHNFRHSRATFLANKLTEAQLKQYLGWEADSDMPAIYVHLSGRDVDDAIMEMRGLKKKQDVTETPLAPKKCIRCSFINKSSSKFCNRCGAVLDVQTAVAMQNEIEKVDEQLAKLLEDDKVQAFLVARMKEMGFSKQNLSGKAPVPA